uniref:NADH-ubiquinone oxidoreductase chain 2 n=1 Tax=Coelophrys brevicaudata TaxID=412625 RepID=D3KRG7_COEBR|nr:NADH dehydrogenase subunit 2 [Coelophrys brevicaudata]BAI77054.1 NADH dehydrogenase subunit 2 [Coelophrys brevicaudata]
MSPYILFTLMFGLGLGTTLTFVSSHWLLAWMGIEMNTLAFIPLMARHHHPRAVEATTKYFLAQAAAAAVLLFAALTNAWTTGQWDINQDLSPVPAAMLTCALALKVGLAPFHVWLPEVLQGLDLATGLILSTWQKLAPFALLFQIHPLHPSLITLLGLTSALMGGWGGLNQTQLRKILAYSSIAHLGWMVVIMQFSPSLAKLALGLYIIMTAATFLVLKMSDSKNINALASSWSKAPTMTALTPLILMSLGGLPPLTGFMPKWLILHELTKQDLGLLATTLAIGALLSLYFYLRLSYAMSLTISPNNISGITPWRFTATPMKLPLAILTSVSLALLPLAPALNSLSPF